MKRLLPLLLVSQLLTIGPAFSQGGNIISVEAGYLNPKDTKSGLLAGIMLGRAIDEAVNIGIGVDFFQKNYTEESQVAQNSQKGLSSTTYNTEVEYTRTIIPLNVVMDVKIPASRYFGYFIRGGLNYEFLISKEKNYKLDTEQSENFSGLGWLGSGGFYYHVGSRSTLIVSATYNSCEVRRDIEESNEGLPVTERVDLSGLGFKLGVSIDMK
jgi:hypothetical protein